MQYTCSKFLTSVLVFYTIHLNNQVLPAVSNSSERKVPVKLKVKLAGNRVGTERSRGVHEWAVHGRRSSGISRVVGPQIYLCAATNTHMQPVGEEPLLASQSQS